MSFVAKANGGGEFTVAPAGNHIARCVQMIYLGTIYSEHYDSWKPKLLIGWELPSEPNGDHGPHVVLKRYTLSLHENAALRKDLESWRGRKFTEPELEGFDVSKVLGHPCMVNVSHRVSSGKTYDDVDAVAPLPKGMECPTQVGPTVKFDAEAPDMKVFETFSERLQETITGSKEWQERQKQPAGAGGGEPYLDADDDIPF